MPEKCWTTGVKKVSCEMFKDADESIVLPFQVHRKIRAITEDIPGNTEWLGYLIGHPDKDGFVVEDIVIPEQEVTKISVNVKDTPEIPNIIGTIHLHPFGSGGMFFSSTDTDFIGVNYPITVVTNNVGDYKAQIKRTLPCGAFTQLEVEVYAEEFPHSKELDKFVQESLTKIKNAPPVVYSTTSTVYSAQSTSHYEAKLFCGKCRSEIMGEVNWVKGVAYHMYCGREVAKEFSLVEGKVEHKTDVIQVAKNFGEVERLKDESTTCMVCGRPVKYIDAKDVEGCKVHAHCQEAFISGV
jgi:hypothetical protein